MNIRAEFVLPGPLNPVTVSTAGSLLMMVSTSVNFWRMTAKEMSSAA